MIPALITVILHEGAIIVDSTNPPWCRLESKIRINDPVELDDDVANTYERCNQMAVVRRVSPENDNEDGTIVSEPRFVEVPTHSTDNWMYCLEHKWYRYATLDLTAITPACLPPINELHKLTKH